MTRERIDDQAVDLSALDFTPACEYGRTPGYPPHDNGCAAQNPAVWLVIKEPVCEHDVDQFFCDSCWGRRNATGKVTCRVCGWVVPCMTNILRLERVRP